MNVSSQKSNVVPKNSVNCYNFGPLREALVNLEEIGIILMRRLETIVNIFNGGVSYFTRKDFDDLYFKLFTNLSSITERMVVRDSLWDRLIEEGKIQSVKIVGEPEVYKLAQNVPEAFLTLFGRH